MAKVVILSLFIAGRKTINLVDYRSILSSWPQFRAVVQTLHQPAGRVSGLGFRLAEYTLAALAWLAVVFVRGEHTECSAYDDADDGEPSWR